MRHLIAAAIIATVAGPSLADIVKVESNKDVAATIDALEVAVGEAGATVFARVDHGAGAQDVDMELGASQLLIFGNPALGTPAMQADPRAGLFLPLKVLAYEDSDGKVWLAYEEPEETFDDLSIDDDAEFLAKMEGALRNLTSAAAGS